MHKLDDITEDAEEGQSTAGESVSTAKPSATVRSLIDVGESAKKATLEERPSVDEQHGKVAEEKSTQPSGSSPKDTDAGEEHEQDFGPLTAPVGKTFDPYDMLFEGGPDPRLSSQTARPALSDLYAEIYAQYNKPKVKLGPRPKASLDAKRPHTSGTGAQSFARPVSSLPSGLRVANRKATESKQANPRDTSNALAIDFAPPPIPAIPEVPASPGYAHSSAASVKSLPLNTYSSHNHRSSGVTPEKQRLMKALELRKKQMQARKEKQVAKPDVKPEVPTERVQDSVQDNVDVAEIPSPEKPTAESVASEETRPHVVGDEEMVASQQEQQQQTSPSNQDDSISTDTTTPTDPTISPPSEGPSSATEIANKQTMADDSHSAASASSPTSAQTAGSSCAPSTRPSSVSEDDHQVLDSDLKLSSGDDVQPVDQNSREDEGDSTESTPTVVPEHSISIPSVEVPSTDQDTKTPRASVQDDNKSIVVPASAQPIRDTLEGGSEGGYTLSMPPHNGQDPAQIKKQKRQSVILSAPIGFDRKEPTEKRRNLIDTDHLTADNSEAEYLSDDSFMEELQSAKVEEAMPMSVSKSPITPFFTSKISTSSGAIPTRSTSHLGRAGIPTRELSSGSRKSWLPPHSNSDTVVMAKKTNVSSGISQRIKALAEKSNRESIAGASSLGTPDSNSSIVHRKSSFFATTPPSGNSPNGRPVSRLYPTSLGGNRSASPSPSPSPSGETKLKIPAAAVSPEQNHPVALTMQQPPEKPESVQVTARIIRDPRVQPPSLVMPTESTPLELRQSDITIDHHKSARPPSRKQSPDKAEPASPVRASSVRETAASAPRSSSETSWRVFGRRMSESKQGAPPSRSRSSHSMDSSDEKQEKQEKKEKKESRASKLFKRMSTMPSSKSRKNSVASSILSEEETATTLPSVREPPSPTQVGDLNIQFPDTLVSTRGRFR